MYIFPIDQLENYQTFAYGEGVFSAKECESILAFAEAFAAEQATVGNSGAYDPQMREAERFGIPWRPDLDWIFQKLCACVAQCNKDFYRFNLTGFLEPLELLRYQAGGFFNWHTDFSSKNLSIRKLSIVVQLTDPSLYEGGELELLDGEKPFTAPRGRGTVVVFPSFVMHRVTPVMAGQRYSLVGWVSGPPYR